MKLLVKANALVDKANQKGTTALMRATQEGNEEVVGILVSAGVDVSKRNNERMNALMLGSQVTSPASFGKPNIWWKATRDCLPDKV